MAGVPSALILRNESWVRPQAARLSRRLPANVERADLIQVGLIAVSQGLTAYGVEVLMVNGPHLPNIEAIAGLSRGKRSSLIDLRNDAGRAQLHALMQGADVFLQGYHPGALASRGFGAEALAERRPGIVVASLSAYGQREPPGPWADRRGFDSLVQTATGFNLAETEAAGSSTPKALPVAAGHPGRQLAGAGVAGRRGAVAAQPGPGARWPAGA